VVQGGCVGLLTPDSGIGGSTNAHQPTRASENPGDPSKESLVVEAYGPGEVAGPIDLGQNEVKASIRCDASHTKSPVKAKRPAAKAKPKAKDAPTWDRTRK